MISSSALESCYISTGFPCIPHSVFTLCHYTIPRLIKRPNSEGNVFSHVCLSVILSTGEGGSCIQCLSPAPPPPYRAPALAPIVQGPGLLCTKLWPRSPIQSPTLAHPHTPGKGLFTRPPDMFKRVQICSG